MSPNQFKYQCPHHKQNPLPTPLPEKKKTQQTRGCIPVKPDTGEAAGAPFLLPNIAEVMSDLKALGEGIVEEVVVVGC